MAMLEPETRPVAPLAITAAFAAPPLYLPRNARARRVKKRPAPALSKRAPIRTKRYTMEDETPRGIPYMPSVESEILPR